MVENWGAKLVTFLIVFVLFWILGAIVLGDGKMGFFVGIVVAAIFVGVSTSIGNRK